MPGSASVAGWTTTFADRVPGSRSFAKATARSRYSTGSSEPTEVSASTAQNASVRKSSSSASGSTPVTSAQGSVSDAAAERRTSGRPSVSRRYRSAAPGYQGARAGVAAIPRSTCARKASR